MAIAAYGAMAADQPLAPMAIERRATGPKDIRIAISYCGICHSDLHQARGEWKGTLYPCVPGHEIIGEIKAVGSDVTGFAVGDTVGLGHMGVKLARAFGAHVVAFTTSPGKVEDAKALGAHEVVVSRNADAMAAHANSFHFILDTVAASHNLDDYAALLANDGTLTLVGVPEHPNPTPNPENLTGGRTIDSSMIGGIAETQEMLDFCGEHGIVADIEMIAADEIEAGFERMKRGDVKYRFVVDTASMAN